MVLIRLFSCICLLYCFLCSATEISKKNEGLDSNEFNEFIILLIEKNDLFLEHYRNSRDVVGKVLGALDDDNLVDVNLKMEAIQINKKACRKLEDYKNFIIGFQNSKDQNIRELVQECLKIIEYGGQILELDGAFIKGSDDFLSSRKNVNKLIECIALINEQYEYIKLFIENILKLKSKSSSINAQVEFQYTEKELNTMGKWKNKTMNDLLQDAYQGDEVALYMVGMSYLYGKGGFPMNVEYADKHFMVSALLGFAPAIDKIRGMYLESDNLNPFLVYVYVNLTAVFGHSEYTMVYHESRKNMGEKFGFAIVREIERIAVEKTVKIYQAMNEIQESEDKVQTTSKMLINGGLVEGDDIFDSTYWEEIFKKNKENQS